jgi:hypothetical protein
MIVGTFSGLDTMNQIFPSLDVQVVHYTTPGGATHVDCEVNVNPTLSYALLPSYLKMQHIFFPASEQIRVVKFFFKRLCFLEFCQLFPSDSFSEKNLSLILFQNLD